MIVSVVFEVMFNGILIRIGEYAWIRNDMKLMECYSLSVIVWFGIWLKLGEC